MKRKEPSLTVRSLAELNEFGRTLSILDIKISVQANLEMVFRLDEHT